jgi:hypothetical protein
MRVREALQRMPRSDRPSHGSFLSQLARGTTSMDHEPCRPPLPDPGYGSRMISRQGPIPLPLIAEPLVGRSPRRPRPWWSRPMTTDVCSMFARMSRYAPAASGTRCELRIPSTGQNGSSRHMSARSGTRSGEKFETSSGLLICGFGVRVPGGAPIPTWDYTTLGHFLYVRFVPMLAPC